MSESYIYLTRDLIPSLRAKAIQDPISQLPNMQYLLKGHTDLSILNLLGLYHETMKHPQLLNYLLALVVYRLTKEPPLGANDGVQVLMLIEYFVTQVNINSGHIWNLYSLPLLQEIIRSEPGQLKDWADELKNCKSINELKIPIGWLFERLKIEILESVSELSTSPSLEMCTKIIKNIKIAAMLNQDVEPTANFAFVVMLKQFFEANDLDDFYTSINYPMKQDISLISSITYCLSGLESYFSKPTKRLLRKINESVEKLRKRKPVKKPFSGESLEGNNIDTDCIIWEKKPIYQHNFGNFSVLVTSGTNAQGVPIIAKSYDGFSPNFDFSYIDSEIKIMTFLSNRTEKRKEFVKLYNVRRSSDSTITLFMENGGINLMNYMTRLKEENKLIDQKIIKSWIIDLIYTFTFLANNRIYHRDIKPHNILVNTKNMTLKVIDFGVSLLSTEIECSYSPTVAHPIQGTEGYMAPELITALGNNQKIANFKPGKSDVFSLGMTILQMITLERLSGFNLPDMNEQLLTRANNLEIEPQIKLLLRKMLDVNRKTRLSFNKCIQFLPIDEKTFIN